MPDYVVLENYDPFKEKESGVEKKTFTQEAY